MVEEAASASVYGFILTWFTPSLLFIFINLVIGTIIITTRFANLKQQAQVSPQLARSPSLIHRLMSINLACYKNLPPPPPTTTTLEETESDTQKPDPITDDPTRVRLARTPSLLERVMSGKFLRLKSNKVKRNEPEPQPGPGSDIGGGESVQRYLGGEEEEEDDGVNEKADNFIKRFKEQLRMQRLDSILRYRDMIKGN
ncbi:hypothetical protein RIF29_08993 [Crotalaria pallida]|uniref:DUF4408 domain-containing protein n=1 Tax=Crotalaria pallida TaxID=3830 RepID=A0AAN9IJG8_CROPI